MTQSLTRVSAMAVEDVGVEEKRLFEGKERRLSFIYGQDVEGEQVEQKRCCRWQYDRARW